MKRSIKRIILTTFDLVLIILTGIFSFLFLNPYLNLSIDNIIYSFLSIVFLYLVIAHYYKMFNKINRYTSIKETIVHCGIVTIAFLGTVIISPFFYSISLRFLFLSYILSAILIPSSRVIWRILNEHRMKIEKNERISNDPALRTLVVGAGEGGSFFVKYLRNRPDITLIGIVDDDVNKIGTTLYGVPILGSAEEIKNLVELFEINQITIAIPSLTTNELDRIVSLCTNTNVKVNQMPPVEDIVQGTYEINKFKEIDVTDLLGREEVKLDMEKIAAQLTDQTILISGAGGSIGSEICRQVSRFSPKRILLLGHGENSIYLIHKELKSLSNKDGVEIVPLIADIQDKNRIALIMEKYKPNIVYHAAAHKHVPLMEDNPVEAVKNNIIGTKNMAEASKNAGVENFVMVSTDKAVNTPNVMGATKRIAEMIVTGLNEKGSTNFVAVRFGNVLNSRGSVIPVFKEQIKLGGPITVTDFRMTRYFMTIPEASRLVLQAGSLANGGEIFVLDMGEPVKIVDLAKKMINLSGHTELEVPIIETGIRPGEKLFEELLTNEESTEEQVYEKIFVGKVTNLPLKKVLHFVNLLDYSSEDKLKKDLVKFANNKYEWDLKSEYINQSTLKNIALSK